MASALTGTEKQALDAFAAALRQALGGDLCEVRLFGSRARGEGNAESDVDVAVIVVAGARGRRREIYDIAYDIGFPIGIDLAPLVIEQHQLQALRDRELLIAKAIDEEGIAL